MPGDQLKICACVVALTVAAGLSGCASRVVERRDASWGAGGAQLAQGSSWEAVLAEPAGGGRWSGEEVRTMPEFGRADDRLGASTVGAQLATGQWPQEARATLDRPRHIYVRDREGRLTYFEREHRREHRSTWWWVDHTR